MKLWQWTWLELLGGGDNGTIQPRHPRSVIEKLQGQEIGRRYYVLLAGETREICCLAVVNVNVNGS